MVTARTLPATHWFLPQGGVVVHGVVVHQGGLGWSRHMTRWSEQTAHSRACRSGVAAKGGIIRGQISGRVAREGSNLITLVAVDTDVTDGG